VSEPEPDSYTTALGNSYFFRDSSRAQSTYDMTLLKKNEEKRQKLDLLVSIKVDPDQNQAHNVDC
jgi:hypothetical protein